MKWLAAVFLVIFILAIYYTIKISAVIPYKDVAVIREMESVPEYKNELTKFNQQSIPQAKNSSEISSAGPSEISQLPEEYNEFIGRGSTERALFQFIGLLGQRSNLASLKESIDPRDWNRDFLLTKMNELLALPLISTSPFIKNSVLLSLVTIPEIKADALQLIRDSVKESSLTYATVRELQQNATHINNDIDDGEILHRQLLASYTILGETDPEMAITRDGQNIRSVASLTESEEIPPIPTTDPQEFQEKPDESETEEN